MIRTCLAKALIGQATYIQFFFPLIRYHIYITPLSNSTFTPHCVVRCAHLSRPHVPSYFSTLSPSKSTRQQSTILAGLTPISQNHISIIMRFRISILITAIQLICDAKADDHDVAPEITVLAEGHNLIAKLPCIGCPFVYRDPSSTQYLGWTTREAENALVRDTLTMFLFFLYLFPNLWREGKKL
jgi:hypothetical protein